MTRPVAGLFGALVATAAIGTATASRAQDTVPIVAVTGCLADQGETWLLTNATAPVPSVANAPPAGQKLAGPTSGTARYRLIGVSEFDLPSHKGHTVLVKGLLVTAEPESRVNVTSVTMVAPACPSPAKP
ncbi:MAG TPA: hypothetical protein VMW48_01690 [Vicinamibacterales bacterium]|nr:hypothetical protein [Vicinamibacterales bacterium]